jgi:hypothetical protein
MRARFYVVLGLLTACGSAETIHQMMPDGGTTTTATGGVAGAGGSPIDAGADAEPPQWLGDAGLVTRAPVQRPLHELCGIASNPGDMPLGDDPASAALRKGYFDAAVDLGGVMIRRDIRFDEVEPQKGTFVWDRYDELVTELQAYEPDGVRMLATLDYGTKWAHPGASDIFWPPDDPQDFADYAGAVAARYAGRFVGYEIWNEPNGGFRFWKTGLSGDPVGYGTLLATAAPAIHAADPTTPVMLGGTVFTPQIIEGAMQWLGEAYAARPDLGKSFEIAGIHTYQEYPPSTAPEIGSYKDAPLEDKISMHAWLLAQHGGDDKPIWITEIGWPVAAPVDEAGQARFTVRATILAARAGAGGIFWYTLRDGPDPTSLPPEDAFGLLHHDYDPAAGNPPSPKPVYVALRALLATVGERWPDPSDPATKSPPSGVYEVAFAGTDPGRVYAMWTATGDAAMVAAPIDGEVREQDGSLRAMVKKGETVAVSGDVTYVK